jgi:hypothetical protein
LTLLANLKLTLKNPLGTYRLKNLLVRLKLKLSLPCQQVSLNALMEPYRDRLNGSPHPWVKQKPKRSLRRQQPCLASLALNGVVG